MIEVRPATLDDAEGMNEVLYRYAISTGAALRYSGAYEIRHHLETGSGTVALDGSRIVGFALTIDREGTRYLTLFFIDAGYRDDDAGKRLLDPLMKSLPETTWVISTTNNAALALYVRFGFDPVLPVYWMERKSKDVSIVDNGCELIDATSRLEEVIAFDAEISGRRREEDHRHWLAHENGKPYLISRDGTIIGYGYLRDDPPAAYVRDHVDVGPVGARSAGDLRDCMSVLIKEAATLQELVKMCVFGVGETVRSLLDLGIHIEETSTFMQQGSMRFDPTLYVPSHREM